MVIEYNNDCIYEVFFICSLYISNSFGLIHIYFDTYIHTGWAEPLLHRIAIDRTAVVYPVVDVIDMNNFEYRSSGGPFICSFRLD